MDDLKSGSCLSMKVLLCTYSTGNHLGNLNFVWRVPDSDNVTEDAMASGNAQATRIIEPSLPVFHTRAMRKHDFSLFRCAKPAVMKEIYRQLTGKHIIICMALYCVHHCV